MKNRRESSVERVRERTGRDWAREARTLSFGLLLEVTVAVCGAQPAEAQSHLWTWQGGSDVVQQLGTYGTLGVAAPTNMPGARDGAATWRDPAGNLWLFGGIGYGSSAFGNLNDLWIWNGSNWTWISGSSASEAADVCGTPRAPAAGNAPGARVSLFSTLGPRLFTRIPPRGHAPA